MASPDNHVSLVEGGCLCGAIRFNLDFHWGSPWPPAPHDCQCTQCRKWSGALVFPWIGVRPDQITWPGSSDPKKGTSQPEGLSTFTEYSSSKGVYRGFCNQCASPFIWRSEKEPEEVGIATGSIDEKYLIGDSEGHDHEGRVNTETGKALAEPISGHLWFENAIKGVTDQATVGAKYLQGSKGPILQ